MKLQKLMHLRELHRSNATVVLIKLMCIFTSSYASIFFGKISTTCSTCTVYSLLS